MASVGPPTLKNSNINSAFVTLNRVSKSYGNLLALDNISLRVREGEVFGYIGPNGAGKTTTMKILIGLLSDFQGEVYVGGYRMPTQKDQVHRLLGYLPQTVAFQEWRTVDNALRTLGRLSGLGEREVNSRITDILGVLGLLGVRHKKIVQLSGGTIQKVGLAQALLHNPRLLVLDEPLAGLDPASRYQLKQIITKLGKDGTTIFFSSHILSDVQDVATRIGILSRGRLKQVGTLDELKSQLPARNAVEIVLSHDSGKWQGLKSVEGVSNLEQPSKGKLVVHLDGEADADETIHSVIQGLIKSGNRIRSVIPSSPTLDEVYLKYVEGDESS
ncbi:ABC transporter ATP-binding protein [Candidatus Bathyarchaeota archaeon]|nr:ABC transporter ATP-binding protein [Candidatus Bathyarchaeota archaeon]